MWRHVLIVLSAVLASPSLAKGPWNNPPGKRMAGLQHWTFPSQSMKVEVGYNICLPPEYGEASKRWPVTYYLHGYKGNESSYLDYVDYWRKSLARSGPSILVLANGGETTFFCDAPDGTLMGERVIRELVAHVDQNYRTIPEGRGRSLHGYSMGGFGALKLAFKEPDMFSAVVAYGATLSTAEEAREHLGKVYARMFGGDPARYAANDPFTLLERNAEQIKPQVRVFLIIGTKDEFLPMNRRLHQRLQALGIPVTLHEVPGARHKKEALYPRTAEMAFEFTARRAPAAAPGAKPEGR